MNIYSARTK